MARVLRPGGRLVLDLANRRALIALVRRQPAFRYTGGEYEVLERFAWDPGSARVPACDFPASRRKALFGQAPNTTREDAHAPRTLRRCQHFGNFLREPLF
jgi:hypothetical protein